MPTDRMPTIRPICHRRTFNAQTQPAYLNMHSARLEPINMEKRRNVLLPKSAGGHPHTTQPYRDLRPRRL